jgi:hypothetical protein
MEVMKLSAKLCSNVTGCLLAISDTRILGLTERLRERLVALMVFEEVSCVLCGEGV